MNASSRLLSQSSTDPIEVSKSDEDLVFQGLNVTAEAPEILRSLAESVSYTSVSLGEVVAASEPSGSEAAGDWAGLYIVCRGRVRLLAPASGERWVSVLTLEPGEVFGAGALAPEAGRCQAIAASNGLVARLPQAALQAWSARLPALGSAVSDRLLHHQRLIFFKTMTELRSLPSHRLDALASLMIQKTVPAGATIAQETPTDLGRCWLRQGQVQSHDPESLPPSPGSTWGYPDAVPAAWTAQTELQIEYLAIEHWSTYQAMVHPHGDAANHNGHTTNGHRKAPRLAPVSDRPARESSTASAPATPEAAPPASPVLFPKPLRRYLLDWLERYPFIQQQSSSDCGVTCLAMISRYWGKRVPIHILRDRANVGTAGASLSALAKAAESLGFQAQPVRASLSKLAEQANPWIAHWQGIHYVVVYQVRRDRVVIADPALGRQTLSRQAFLENWTGYALLLAPGDRFREVEVAQPSLWRYLHALWPYRGLAAQILAVSLLIQIFGIISPLFTQIILDQVVVQKSQVTLQVFVIGLFIFGIWSMMLSAVRQYLLSYFSNRLDLTLISGFISHTLLLPLKFFESRRVGDILTRVQENQKIQRFLIGQVVLAWLDFLTGFVYLGLMFYYNWQLTLLALCLIPPIVLITLGSTPFLRQMSREVFNASAEQNSSLVELITGVSTIKGASVERELRWRWEDTLTNQINVRFKAQNLAIGLQLVSGLINSLGGTALLWYGATLVIQDQLSIGQFVAFNMMIGYVIRPILALAQLWDELQEVLISVERLDDIFETEPEEHPQRPMLVMPPIRGAVTLENVTFRYSEEEEQNTLQNLSLEVAAGQTVAIVGRSGSGKSTLVKLLQSLYAPTSGRIWIDGHDIRHVSPQSLRSQMGVVPQECFLFSGTILENITLHRPDFHLEEAIEVAKLAEAHSFIQALPMGYNTKVGERGSTLSGGQRQRVAIARALLGNPRILILDEATSSLDTESERRFQQNLAQISRDRTAFIIAHRLSTVRNADLILVLDRGVLVEQGTHETLMEARGLYYHLAQQQLNL